MKYKHISNVLATTKRTNGTLLALMIVGLATLLFLACPEPDSGGSSGSSGTGGVPISTDGDGDGTDTGGTDGGKPTPTSPDPAKWAVTFRANGGTDVKTQHVTKGEAIGEENKPTNPTRASKDTTVSTYAFVDWYTEKEFTTPFVFTTLITESIALYAKWKVTFTAGITAIPNEHFLNTPLGAVGMEIPNTVETIGDRAFENTGIMSITLGTGVTAIDEKAFYKNKLTAVTIPDKVTTIGDNAFSFNNLKTVTIPDKVTTIGDNAFSFNNLKTVTIGSEVTTIGEAAFANHADTTNKITTLTLGAKVETIGKHAFAGHQLDTITIPASVTKIDSEAFYADVKNPKLTKVIMTKKLYKALGDGAYALSFKFTFKGATTGNFNAHYEDSTTNKLNP